MRGEAFVISWRRHLEQLQKGSCGCSLRLCVYTDSVKEVALPYRWSSHTGQFACAFLLWNSWFMVVCGSSEGSARCMRRGSCSHGTYKSVHDFSPRSLRMEDNIHHSDTLQPKRCLRQSVEATCWRTMSRSRQVADAEKLSSMQTAASCTSSEQGQRRANSSQNLENCRRIDRTTLRRLRGECWSRHARPPVG